jgi:hypothetical protein
VFAGEPQRDATGHQQLDLWTDGQQIGQEGRDVQDLLEVVEQQQQRAGAERGLQVGEERAPAALP